MINLNRFSLRKQTIFTSNTIQRSSRIRSHRSFSLKNSNLTNPKSSKPNQVSFPCIDQNEERSKTWIKDHQEFKSIQSNQNLSNQNLGFNLNSNFNSSIGPEPIYSSSSSSSSDYKTFHYSKSFELDYGESLKGFVLRYETWGNLSKSKDNVILLHTGLSANSHAKSHPSNPNQLGWWENFIGHGSSYPIDLNRFYLICINVLGSCFGSTGPSSINPESQEPFATHFPIITIFDIVRSQFKLLDELGIQKLFASVGSSMGGMQSIAATWLFPDRVGKLVSISGCGRSAPSSIALRYAQRSVLMSDPNWNRGFYYDQIPPHVGMKLARQIATITYRSGPEWEQRFSRRRQNSTKLNDKSKEISPPVLCPDFLIESYLDHQGEQFCLKYDANSLIYLSKAMDLFDMTTEGLRELSSFRTQKNLRPLIKASSLHSSIAHPTLNPAKSHVSSLPINHLNIINSLSNTFQTLNQHPILILGIQSDLLFPINQQRELAESFRLNGNPNVIYYELDSPFGHDTFLIDVTGVGGALRGFLS
ncbi:Alpha/Beta hydrolase protein [Melampsora americana]|nr:Alpha/Beta hydrolase protein [Melampsora americana]